MKKTVLAAIASLAVAFTTHASAADLAVKAAPAPIPPAPPTWTGCYLGGTVGAGLGSTEFLDPDDEFTDQNARLNGFGANVGVTGGCNWQVRSFVLGAEGDWSWTNFSKSQIGFGDTTDPDTIESKFKWFSTARARAGWAYDNILFYGTGGVAFLNVEHNAHYAIFPFRCGDPFFNTCETTTETGLAVGVGIEAMVWQNLSVKLEYLFLDMPSRVKSFSAEPTIQNVTWNDTMHVVRLGLNYHFNWGAPVAARY